MSQKIKIDLGEVNTKNTKVQFDKDENGKPYLEARLVEGEMDGDMFFVLTCKMPKGLSVKHNEAAEVLTKVKEKMIAPIAEVRPSFDGEESEDAMLGIFCLYPNHPILKEFNECAMSWDIESAQNRMSQLCREFVVKKLSA